MSLTLLGADLVWMLGLSARELMDMLRGLHCAALRLRPMPDVELLLVRDAEMAQYNAQFMDCAGPTNILSFPAEPVEPVEFTATVHSEELQPTASLVLSVDTLRREAFLYGENLAECHLRLLAHGMGHVAGLDHGDEMDVFCCNIIKLQNKNSG